MINLDRLIFPDINEELKKEIKGDISKFGLKLANDITKIEILETPDRNTFVLDCNYLLAFKFKFPNGSEDDKINNTGEYGPYKNIEITFKYNNKKYIIKGYI